LFSTIFGKAPAFISRRDKAELAWARLRGNDRSLSYFVDRWNYFNERAARTCFSTANYQVLRRRI
jgi:hypothetical protein